VLSFRNTYAERNTVKEQISEICSFSEALGTEGDIGTRELDHATVSSDQHFAKEFVIII